jgi:hypothetical protein
LTAPERPNSKIIAKPITKGGLIIGKSEAVRMRFLARIPVRVTIKAKAKPSPVVVTPTKMAMKNEFQAIPQFKLLVKQLMPQIFLEVNFSINGKKTKFPSAS